MKLKELINKYGEYEVSEAKGDWCDADHIILELNKPKPKTVWDLTVGDTQYNINPHGIVVPLLWDGGFGDTSRRDFGSVFLTKEEAEQDVERRKVETLLLKHGGRRWFNSKGDNWYLVRENNDFETYQAYCILPLGAIYFDSEEQAEKAVIEIGKNRLVKALFEVR